METDLLALHHIIIPKIFTHNMPVQQAWIALFASIDPHAFFCSALMNILLMKLNKNVEPIFIIMWASFQEFLKL
jgi:hypothetical protein